MEAVSVENSLVARALATAPSGVFINGTWREARGDGEFDVINPATGNVITRVADADAEDGLAALEAAAAAQESWARTAPRARAELLRNLFEIVVERAEEFAVLMTIEMGKPLAEARGEVAYGAEFLRWFSEEAVRLNGRYSTTPEGGLRVITMPRPVGPVLAITPWNFPHMGEACNAANRFYVSRELVDEFAARLAAEFEGLVVGDGLDLATDIGPIITSGQRQRLRELVKRARERGARVLTGGEDVTGPGYFYRPTVLTVADPGDPVVCEELFGPVAPVVPFDSEEQVLAWANSSPVGLAAYVHTGDIDRALRMAERLEVGMTGINSAAISNPAAPFGGVKHSGLGREGGSEGIAEYLETIYVGIPV